MSDAVYQAILDENQRQAKLTMREHAADFGTDWQPIDGAALWRAIRGLNKRGYSLVLRKPPAAIGDTDE